MPSSKKTVFSSRCFGLPGLAGLLVGVILATHTIAKVWADVPETAADANTVPAAFQKNDPEDVADLIAMENQIRKVSKLVVPTTVNLQIGNAQGSGVIVSKEGEILTAAHVIGRSGREVRIILSDGRRVKGETLGLNRELDIGLVKIVDKGDWPVAEMADMKDVKVGDWCLATGHPGGIRKGRPPVVRLGRVIMKRNKILQTDCTLVGGDSGGPVFSVEGKVIGINSRIGASTAWNFHVPVSAYQDNWDRLVKAESFDVSPGPPPGGPILGVSGDDHENGCIVTHVHEDMPAKIAGLEVGDVITTFDGKDVEGFDSLAALVQSRKPGDRVKVEYLRDEEKQTKMIELGKKT